MRRRILRVMLILLLLPPVLAAVAGWLVASAYLHPTHLHHKSSMFMLVPEGRSTWCAATVPSGPNSVVEGLLAFRYPLGVMPPDDVFGVAKQRRNVGDRQPRDQQSLRGGMPELMRMPVDSNLFEDLRVDLSPIFC